MPSPASLEMISKLVSFDTTSRDSNMDLINFVQTYLSDLGIESTLVPNEDRSKASLYATVGPTDKPGVMLSGHTDVVPVDGQNWKSDPFTVVEREAKLFGRGTSDMKSFIALVLASLPEFINRGLDTPLHLAFSYDEEVGCVGVRPMIDMINGLPIKPRMAIIGEPTSMQVITGHKGKRSYTAHVHGLEAHSSLAPQGVNAIEYAARLITQDFAQPRISDRLYHAAIKKLRVGGNIGHVINACRRDIRIRNHLLQFFQRILAGPAADLGIQHRHIPDPARVVLEAGIGFQIRPLHDVTQPRIQRFRIGTDQEPASVPGRIGTGRCCRRNG